MPRLKAAGSRRRAHQVDDVLLHLLVEVDAVHQRAQPCEVGRLQDPFDRLRRLGTRHAPYDGQLLVTVGVADHDLQHEPVDLRLRQRVGAFLLDRILRGQHHERVVQRMGGVADRHLPLLHRLQQRALHLGGGAVDLVGQHDVGEDRPLLGGELAGSGVVDEGAHQVGRQQVRGELDAPEAGTDRLRQGGDRQRLGQAGDAFDQQVGVGDQADQQAVEQPVLTDDLLAELVAHPLEDPALALHLFRYLANVHVRCLPPCSGLLDIQQPRQGCHRRTGPGRRRS